MKIIFIVPHYYPLIGGVETYAQTLAEDLAKRHDVIVVTSGDRNVTEKINDVTIYRLSHALKLSNTPIGLLWYFKIRRIIRRERPDIVNAHSPVPFMADMAALAKGAVPLVVTYHAGSMLKGDGGLIDRILSIYERWGLPWLFRRARQVVAVYKPFVDTKVDDPGKVTFIPPGINTRLYVPKTTPQKADVAFVGRVQHTSSWKGLDVLMEAIALAKQKQPDITLHIVGDGDAIEMYEQMSREMGIENNVVFVGAFRGEALADAYRQSKVVVLPSKTEAESFGMVLAEAQSAGVAVIGSHIGGIPQVVADGETGLLVPPGDAIALAEAIVGLLKDDRKRALLGEKGSQRIRELFSEEHLIDSTEQLLTRTARPRIIHVASNYPPRLGGLENVVKELAVEQYRQGRDVRVVTSKLGYRSDFHDEVPVRRLWALELAHTPLMPLLLFSLLRLKKNDVVHIHIAQAFVPEIVRLASLIKGFPYVAHVHLDVAPSGPAGLLLKVYKPLVLGPVLRRAKFVIVFTDEQRQLMIERYRLRDDQVVIVPNGVGAEFFVDTPRTLHKVPRLLFVGRLSKQKNLSLLLQALDGISEGFDTRIVGDGDLRHVHEQNAAQLKLKNVHFYGRKDGEELKRQYREADIFVLPSEREGMPLVLLEAMAMALPIVGTDVTGIRDVVVDGQTGYLAPLGDVETYRTSLMRASEDAQAYTEMSRSALDAAAQYSWPIVSRRFEELYEA